MGSSGGETKVPVPGPCPRDVTGRVTAGEDVGIGEFEFEKCGEVLGGPEQESERGTPPITPDRLEDLEEDPFGELEQGDPFVNWSEGEDEWMRAAPGAALAADAGDEKDPALGLGLAVATRMIPEMFASKLSGLSGTSRSDGSGESGKKDGDTDTDTDSGLGSSTYLRGGPGSEW